MIASWITAKTNTAFYARKSIMLKSEIESATAKVCGLGQFNFYINGEKISDHLLDPGWSDYDKYIQYVTFDVTDEVLPGANVLAAEVGTGFYSSYDKPLILFVELLVKYTDGSTEVFITDDSWRIAKHPVLFSNEYGAETMDGRLRKYGWGEVDYDDSDWDFAFMADEADIAKGELLEQKHPETKALRTFAAEYLGESNGRKIYDLKQNLSGILHVHVKGKAGDEIKIYSAEKLTADGDVNQISTVDADMIETENNGDEFDNVCCYIIGEDDRSEQFTSTFTYFAGRYVGVAAADDVEIESVYADYITSAWDSVGDFDCDDERFMKVLALVDRAVEANMIAGMHTDNHSFGRWEWLTADCHMAPSIMFMKNGRLIWEKKFLDLKVYSAEFERNVDAKELSSLTASLILGLRWHYKYYGDLDLVGEYFDTCTEYFKILLATRDENGLIQYNVENRSDSYGEHAVANTETAFLYADACALSEFAKLLGKDEDYDSFSDIANEIKDNYNEKLLVKHPDFGFMCYRNFDNAKELVMTQACEALPLYFGLVPDNAIIDVQEAFKHVIKEDGTFAAETAAMPYIIATMASLGMQDKICDFILSEEQPGYYAQVLAGETTLADAWNNPASHCSDALGAIVDWYYTGIAGIKSQAPAFKKVLIEPYLPASMNHMHCFYESAGGDIEVELTREDDQIRLDVNVDDGIELEVSRKYIGEYK